MAGTYFAQCTIGPLVSGQVRGARIFSIGILGRVVVQRGPVAAEAESPCVRESRADWLQLPRR